jgi:hypothetical protein
MPGKMFGSTRDELSVEWRKLYNEQLHSLYSSPCTAMVGHVTQIKETRNVYRILVGKPLRV